jgi:hypothetical protein
LIDILQATEKDKTQFDVNDVLKEIKLMNTKLLKMDNAISSMNDKFSEVMMNKKHGNATKPGFQLSPL